MYLCICVFAYLCICVLITVARAVSSFRCRKVAKSIPPDPSFLVLSVFCGALNALKPSRKHQLAQPLLSGVYPLPAFSRHSLPLFPSAANLIVAAIIVYYVSEASCKTIPLFTPTYNALHADSSSSHVLNPPHNCYICTSHHPPENLLLPLLPSTTIPCPARTCNSTTSLAHNTAAARPIDLPTHPLLLLTRVRRLSTRSPAST